MEWNGDVIAFRGYERIPIVHCFAVIPTTVPYLATWLYPARRDTERERVTAEDNSLVSFSRPLCVRIDSLSVAVDGGAAYPYSSSR